MRFSVWPEPGRSVSEILDLARLADELGWFGFWFADHYMPNTGSTDIKPGDVHEVWSILPAVAAVTNSIRIGPLVAPTSVHHPALLANRIATLDHVSAGSIGTRVGSRLADQRARRVRHRARRTEDACRPIRRGNSDRPVPARQ